MSKDFLGKLRSMAERQVERLRSGRSTRRSAGRDAQATGMPFLGKWTLTASDGKPVVASTKSGALSIGDKSATEDPRLNAYGTEMSFMLQSAGNGKYVKANASGYAASEARDGNVSYFALEKISGGKLRVVDLGIKGAGSEKYYWNENKAALERVKKNGSPPATTAFEQTVVTVGLATFTGSGFQSHQPDLTWANLAGADLSRVDFAQADLANADLSQTTLNTTTFNGTNMTPNVKLAGCKAPEGATTFQNCPMQGADLTNAELGSFGISFGPKTNLDGASLIGANLNNTQIVQTSFVKAHMKGVKMGGGQVSNVDFTGADLTGACFLKAQVTDCILIDTNLTNAKLSNTKRPDRAFGMHTMKLSAKTNFTGAQAQFMNFTGFDLSGVLFTHADLSHSKLDQTNLEGADMSFATFDECTFTGNVRFFGANLANASLSGANLTGAQMGSIAKLFAVPDDTAHKQQYSDFLDGLKTDDASKVKTVFNDNKIPLTGTIDIGQSSFAAGRVWTVKGTVNQQQKEYTVRLETLDNQDSLNVYEAATAAVLSNAFMKGVKLTSANLYNVRASGVQLYGGADLQGSAVLEGAQFNNGNLSEIKLEQAFLYGVNFDYCQLFGAKFDGAFLTVSAGGGQASFNGSNLAGASFEDAHLDGAIFSNAAVAVPQPKAPTNAAGVWLFDVPAKSKSGVADQLEAAQSTFSLTLAQGKQLQPGPVQAGTKQAFSQNGITLSAEALVSVVGVTAYWQIDDGSSSWVVYQGLQIKQEGGGDSIALPALAVAKGTDPFAKASFFIPLSLETDLANGTVNQSIVDAFKTDGKITLSSSATVTIKQEDSDWEIVDSSGIWGLWLDLDAASDPDNPVLDIMVRKTMPAVMALFTNNSYPLSRRATVMNWGTDFWAIDNDSSNPFNPIKNYIKFNALEVETGVLSIFGSWMRVERLQSADQQTYFNYVLGITEFAKPPDKPEDVLPNSVVCPNSLTVKSNKTDKLAFDQWMRARIPPRAPFCIPDANGEFYCPQ